MNNLDKLRLLEDYIHLRRKTMKLDENDDRQLLNESTACSSEGAGSRTGMSEEFAQDATTSSERKRSMEGYKKLEEGLDSYYRVAGLK